MVTKPTRKELAIRANIILDRFENLVQYYLKGNEVLDAMEDIYTLYFIINKLTGHHIINNKR